jgi:hypothetical protein
MRSGLLFASSLTLVALSAIAAFAGCTTKEESSEQSESQLDTAEDIALAKNAIKSIAGANAKCTQCHTAGKDDVKRWGAAMKTIEDACLSSTLTLTAKERIACLRIDSADPDSGYSAEKLGLYAAAATHTSMKELFAQAYGDAGADAQYSEFKVQAGMPIGNMPGINETDFAVIKQWVMKGMPAIDTVMDEPGAFPCVPKMTPEMIAHMTKMKTDGWAAKHADNSTPMARCGTATQATECLTNFPNITTTWGPAGTTQTLRQIKKMTTRSSYWTRSSADGRFVAQGGSPSRIIDINAADTVAPVTAAAPYDPGFFPNNDGFSFAGTQAGGLRVCRQSVLLNALTTPERRITFSEPGCTQIINTVYQSVGAALDGSLFWMVTGAHTNDPGGSSGPLSASFGANATTTMTPMYNDGTRYVPGQNVFVKFPFEGDQQMSPSNTLLITRFGQKAGTSGYRIRKVVATIIPPGGNPDGGAADASTPVTDAGTSSEAGSDNNNRDNNTDAPLPTVEVSTQELATVCLAGGKPQLSFDERFMAVHQYTDSNANPLGLPAGTSNIFVIDLKTSEIYQVTKVAAGQQALYPHFRADGWLYFIVRESGKETIVASDVVLHVDTSQ